MALYTYCLSARKAVVLENIEMEGLSEAELSMVKLESIREVLFQALLLDDVKFEDGKMYAELSGIIQAYLENQTKVCAIQIWQEALGQSGTPPKWKAADINSIISKVPGWVKIKNVSRFGTYGSQRGFERMPTNKNDFVTVDTEQQNELPFD